MIVDTSALLAFFNHRDPAHAAVTDAFTALTDSPVVSPFVVAELDYLISTRLGVPAELAVLRELAGGAWELPTITPADLAAVAQVLDRYADQEIDVADGSLVVLADRYRTRTVITLDRRHFDVLRALDGQPFTVLP